MTKKKVINANIILYGALRAGKTSNIQFIHRKLRPSQRGQIQSMSQEGYPHVAYEFLPIELGELRGYDTNLYIYTAPMHKDGLETRLNLLNEAAGVVFIVDSAEDRLDDNIESLTDLKDELSYWNIDYDTFPVVFQHNKRDLPNAMEVEELERQLNPEGKERFEAVSSAGQGVRDTFALISKMAVRRVRLKLLEEGDERGAGGEASTVELTPDQAVKGIKVGGVRVQTSEVTYEGEPPRQGEGLDDGTGGESEASEPAEPRSEDEASEQSSDQDVDKRPVLREKDGEAIPDEDSASSLEVNDSEPETLSREQTSEEEPAELRAEGPADDSEASKPQEEEGRTVARSKGKRKGKRGGAKSGESAPKPEEAPESKELAPESEALAPESKALAPESKALAPESKALAPESKELAPESEEVEAGSDDLSLEAVEAEESDEEAPVEAVEPAASAAETIIPDDFLKTTFAFGGEEALVVEVGDEEPEELSDEVVEEQAQTEFPTFKETIPDGLGTISLPTSPTLSAITLGELDDSEVNIQTYADDDSEDEDEPIFRLGSHPLDDEDELQLDDELELEDDLVEEGAAEEHPESPEEKTAELSELAEPEEVAEAAVAEGEGEVTLEPEGDEDIEISDDLQETRILSHEEAAGIERPAEDAEEGKLEDEESIIARPEELSDAGVSDWAPPSGPPILDLEAAARISAEEEAPSEEPPEDEAASEDEVPRADEEAPVEETPSTDEEEPASEIVVHDEEDEGEEFITSGRFTAVDAGAQAGGEATAEEEGDSGGAEEEAASDEAFGEHVVVVEFPAGDEGEEESDVAPSESSVSTELLPDGSIAPLEEEGERESAAESELSSEFVEEGERAEEEPVKELVEAPSEEERAEATDEAPAEEAEALEDVATPDEALVDSPEVMSWGEVTRLDPRTLQLPVTVRLPGSDQDVALAVTINVDLLVEQWSSQEDEQA